MRWRQFITCAVVVSVVLVAHLGAPTSPPTLYPASQTLATTVGGQTLGTAVQETALGRLPLQFEVNEGQADAAVRFLAHGRGYNLFLASDEALLALSGPEPGQPPAVLRLEFVGAAAEPRVAGEGQLPGVVNYYLGRDPSQWHTGIAT